MQRLFFVTDWGFVMRTSFVVGTFALVFAVAGASACGSNGTSGNKQKVDGKAPVAHLEATPVAIRETAGTVGTRPDDLDKGVRYTVVLGEGKSGFRVNAVTLSDEAKAKIDELFTSSKADLTVAHFVVEGHTDSLGSKDVNERIGLARAEAVKQYLCERYEIPPDSISVISYGLEQPVADNATGEGRALNRRVVIKVLD
jgi:outer membrane protein OmpA-like peptidoglycan-associated protein